MTKVCPVCNRELPATPEYFYMRSGGRAGAYCKSCAKAKASHYHHQNREQILKAKAVYRDEHRDAINKHIREYRRANPEQKQALDKAYRAANLSRLKAQARARYRQNPAPYIKRAKVRADNNPEQERERLRAKRFKRRGVPLDADARRYASVLLNDPCSYCGQWCPDMEIDHIEAVSKGGDSHYSNLTAACPSCNKAKHNKSLLAYLMEAR